MQHVKPISGIPLTEAGDIANYLLEPQKVLMNWSRDSPHIWTERWVIILIRIKEPFIWVHGLFSSRDGCDPVLWHEQQHIKICYLLFRS